MTDEWHELPVAELHRGCEIYARQSEGRIAEAKRQIDVVIGMSHRRRLAEFACDASKAPEARLLAKNKALASLEQRLRVMFDLEHLIACTIGIAQRERGMGRLIGWYQAGWWPEAWRPRG
jgi:hypothetical protein